ncbi:cyclic peptide export ABC transporter [Methylobacterium aquaticum]|uniref:cyclic peptide export ABC transporter n=1 Tax=Methylobacterium aquaticum TaxID=270351 RepID=UPI003D16D263
MTASFSSRPAGLVLGLVRPYAGVILACAVLGALGGLSVAGLLALVNRGLHDTAADGSGLLAAFVGLCLLTLVGSIGSDIGANVVGQRVVATLRKTLADRILAAPIDALERYRLHRLIPVLTRDVDTISDVAFALSTLAVALTVTAGCLAYLAVLSPALFGFVVLAVTLGVCAQTYAQMRGVAGFVAARAGEDRLQAQYRAITEGAKELRLHRGRRHRHAALLRDAIDDIRDRQIHAIVLFVTARAFGTVLFFAVVGATLALRHFVWPEMDAATVSGFVLVLLYMRGPVDQVIGTLPVMGRALVALRRVADLSERFATPEPGLVPGPAVGGVDSGGRTIRSIALRGATYAFPAAEGGKGFVLGPVDLRVEAGETVFVVGENGSGKTTLIKLLLALYVPDSGDLVLDGTAVTAATRDEYRQLFTTIFSDYHLFEDLAGPGTLPEQAARYLERLEIAGKVGVRDGALTTLDLSTGQRKRLALLNAWLEGRPVLVFDEWAADQDPAFRRIFYAELLPDLKRLGKTIVVISHDDRYFDAADRIVRIEAGRIVADEPPGRHAERPGADRPSTVPGSPRRHGAPSPEPTRP